MREAIEEAIEGSDRGRDKGSDRGKRWREEMEVEREVDKENICLKEFRKGREIMGVKGALFKYCFCNVFIGKPSEMKTPSYF